MANSILKFTFLTLFTAATSLFLSAIPASAELKYTLKIENLNYPNSYVSFSAKPLGCSDIEYKRKRDYYNFWRSKKCGGEQGQMRIDIFRGPPSKPYWRFYIEYSNSGEIRIYAPHMFNGRTNGGRIYIKNENNRICVYKGNCKGTKFTIVVK